MPHEPPWRAFREPLQRTLLRNGAISILVGGVIAKFGGGLSRWPILTLLALWPALGGHWLEVWFLNWLRPRIAAARPVQVSARIAVWFAGGIAFAFAIRLTARALTGHWPARWVAWWLAGLAFICLELAVHSALQFRSRPSFYNGRG